MQVKDATGDTTRLLVVGDFPQRGEYAPLVALWLRVTQSSSITPMKVRRRSSSGMSSGRDPGEIGGRLEQAIAHAAGAGSERVHRVGRFAWHALHRC